MAEFMLAQAAAESGRNVVVDSAGTSAWELGNPIDSRAKAVLARHGVTAADHTARQFQVSWFANCDLVLALDTDHYHSLRAMAPDAAAAAKVRMLRSFDPKVAGETPEHQGIYDPWYGDDNDFEVSWNLISAAIPGVLAHVRG